MIFFPAYGVEPVGAVYTVCHGCPVGVHACRVAVKPEDSLVVGTVGVLLEIPDLVLRTQVSGDRLVPEHYIKPA